MDVCAGPSSIYSNPRNKMKPMKRGKSLANCVNKSTKYAMGSSNWYQRDVLKSLRGCVDSSFLENLKNINSSNQADNILNKCLYKIDHKEYGGNDINIFPLPRLPGKSYNLIF